MPKDAKCRRKIDSGTGASFTEEVSMAQYVSSSITRRSAVAALTAAPVALLPAADNAYAEVTPKKNQKSGKSLYERLGGVFAIAAVVDHFSDALVKNPIVGQGSQN